MGSRDRLVKPPFDPGFHVSAAEAEVSSDPESGWSLAAVPPVVDGGQWNPEILGDFLRAE